MDRAHVSDLRFAPAQRAGRGRLRRAFSHQAPLQETHPAQARAHRETRCELASVLQLRLLVSMAQFGISSQATSTGAPQKTPITTEATELHGGTPGTLWTSVSSVVRTVRIL